MKCNQKTGVIFDSSFDGFLCIIYDFYYKKIIPQVIVCENKFQQSLNIEYLEINTDCEKASIVAISIKKKSSQISYDNIYCAFLNNDDNKYMDLFTYVIALFKIGKKIDLYEQWDFVRNVHKYAQNTLFESYFFKEIIRFKETQNNILYARIEPDNHVLPLIADHFVSRLIDERWIIHDATRKLAIVYDSNKWAIYETPSDAVFKVSETEDNFQDLWLVFFNEISIKERESKKRQRRTMPLKYRKNMIEFKR